MAAASLGRLTLDLAVKLGSFEQGMTQAKRKTKDTTEKMGKAFGGFKSQVADALGGTQIGSIVDSFNAKIGSLKGGAMVAGAAFAGMAVGGIAVAFGALSKLAIDTAKADAQLLVLANRANTSAENFQILQYAASGLGVTQDQLGSILADVQEKLGEFSATSGGEAVEFFDALKNNTKMTEDQIKSFGKTLQGKDGIEAIQILNDKMDELGVTSQERRFIFESLASDLAHLAPIFAENGDLLEKYGDALRDAGVIKSGEALEQSKLLAAQTESVRMRFDGLKSQLAEQMMPALNSLLSHFIDGATKGGQFGGVINSVGTIAKGVGAVVIGVAGAIEIIINQIKAFLAQSKNIGRTAVAVWNADGFIGKSMALVGGIAGSVGIAQQSIASSFAVLDKTVRGAASMFDSATVKTDKLTEANLAIAEAAKQSAAGLKTNTKEADENAKAKEKAAKETEKLNKQLQVNAKVQSNASKYNFAGIESQYQLPSGLLSAINMQESRGNANAIGPMTKYGQAKGGFQFLDGTAKRFGLIGSAVFDTGKSAEAAAKYFQFLYQKFGTWEKAISAYHAGEGNVERGTGLGPINREYVKNVLGYMDAALKGVGTTAADAVKYVEEVYKSQQSIVLKYLSEQEKMELEHAVSTQEIKDAFAENDPSREKYLKLQQLAYQKDVVEFKKAQDEKRQAAFNGVNNPIGDMVGIGVNARARASLSSSEYDQWSMNNSQQDGYSQLSDSLYSARSGIESNEYLSETEKYQQLNDAYKVYLDGKKALTEEYAKQDKELLNQQKIDQLNLWSGVLGQAQNTFAQLTQSAKDSAGEQSSTYKAMFAMQKAFSIASSIAAAWTAYTTAFADPSAMTLAQKFAGGAAVMAALTPALSTIASVSIDGMAHDGIDNIPKEGTWLLDKGERVVDSRTNSDLKNYLNEARSNSSGAKITVNNNTGAQVNARQNPDGSVDIDVIERQLAGRLGNPNSTLSKSLKQNTTASRRR